MAAVYDRLDLPRLQAALDALAAGVLRREFAVAATPHRASVRGLPGRGRSLLLAAPMTRRATPDRLF